MVDTGGQVAAWLEDCSKACGQRNLVNKDRIYYNSRVSLNPAQTCGAWRSSHRPSMSFENKCINIVSWDLGAIDYYESAQTYTYRLTTCIFFFFCFCIEKDITRILCVINKRRLVVLIKMHERVKYVKKQIFIMYDWIAKCTRRRHYFFNGLCKNTYSEILFKCERCNLMLCIIL